ncbi:PH domain-containing protein [Stenotrophomonas sp. 24(2023)]|uniref:PH domain-containing protein n=1 Tax=Stenotrophomonas sp. 24(2023) TaxID=3068324 RepID=UPI0027E1B040|nr:PH domain-containing protein [Stenotrophomonas sp. 24(2023)]WMJ70648.1 PH domain-containing protein [Stenotrophomonas sp. 24(2023)]
MHDLPADALPAAHWQPLPPRAAHLKALEGLLGGLFVPGLPLLAGWWFTDRPGGLWAAAALLLAAAALMAFIGHRRTRRTFWRLDAQGLGLRRDLLWQVESRVPVSRVQHLDLRRGPLQRSLGLATLVVHTAGTRMSAVSVHGLAVADAERLRDTLSHQLDQDDDAL